MACSDLSHFGLLRCRALGNRLAPSRLGIELPAVETALHSVAVVPAVGKWHSLVGTGIQQGERTAATVPPQDERRVEQRELYQLVSAHLLSLLCAIPESEQHGGREPLLLGLHLLCFQSFGGR